MNPFSSVSSALTALVGQLHAPPSGGAGAEQALLQVAQQAVSAPAEPAHELSGAQWVSRFPGSSSLDDLSAGFRAGATSFVDALRAAGAAVFVSATLRPPQRAYLMHWAWAIVHGTDPSAVPARADVAIGWVHPTPAQSRQAAQAMVDGYGLVHEPALTSRHIEGRAIDMSISWSSDLAVRNAAGSTVTISTTPRDGGNAQLQEVGRSYGVIKLQTDPPHWSDDGS